MATPPIQPTGRGGRGALLLSILKDHPRRPGQVPQQEGQGEGQERPSSLPKQPAAETSPQTLTSPKIPIGRGAFLKTLPHQLEASKPTPLPVVSESGSGDARSSISPALSFGRGILGRGLLGRGRQTPSTLTSPTPSVPSLPSVSPSPSGVSVSSSSPLPPTSEMAELSLKKPVGTAGTPCKLAVNYIKLKTAPEKSVFEYHVAFNPQVESKSIRFKIINQPQIKSIIGKTKTFDGAKLYLPFRLPSPVTRLTATIPPSNLSAIVDIKYVGGCEPRERIHLYNVLFRRVMNILKMTQVGRNYFDPHGGFLIPQHKLEVWPGYVTAVQDFEGGIMINCDSSFRVLRTVTARDILYDLVHTHPNDFKDAALKQLIGTVALTRYNNKTYRIDDIAWDQNPRCSFTSHNGQEITFQEYYQKSYDIVIQDDNQPLLIHKPKKKIPDESERLICLIPELCFMTGLTADMRSDFKVMKDIAVHTRITPNQRQQALKKYIENVNSCEAAKQALADWGLELESATLSLDGRVLPIETIYLKNKNFQVPKEADWGRCLNQDSVITAVDLVCWLVVYVRRDAGKAHDFIQMMKKICPSMGINVRDPIIQELPNDRTETYLHAMKSKINPRLQVTVVIFPTPRDDRYNAIKKLCCVEMPIPSQVINSRTISQYQKLRSVTQKIALQINCKLGGELWSLHIPMQNIMVCGIDAYHDISRGKKSVLGFVASLNNSLTRWYSMTTFQHSGQEMGDCLKMSLLTSLRKYYQVNHTLPSKIFIYRDGVSDGQLKYVSEYEIEQMATCFQHFDQNYEPSLIVIVVQKRINTRMFSTLNGRNGVPNLDNPSPGTVIDHTITRKNWYDFFLVSQHVRQGTVSPTHYVVIRDDSNLKADHIQRLSYKLTHLYYNWPGTVRVPAPCQYAHKLAYLVGQNIHKEPSTELADKLFYL